MISESSSRVENIILNSPLGSAIQGHKTIRFELRLASENRSQKFNSRRYAFERGDYVSMKKEFIEIDWEACLAELTVDEAYNLFLTKYNAACVKYIPLRRTRVTTNPPWMNTHIVELIKQKKRLWSNNKRNNWRCAELVKQYKRTCVELKNETSKAISTYEERLAYDKKNPKKLYSYVNSKQQIKSGISSLKDVNGVVYTEHGEMANILNEHFSSVFVKEEPLGNLNALTNHHFPTDQLTDLNLTFSTVQSKLESLDKSKSP